MYDVCTSIPCFIQYTIKYRGRSHVHSLEKKNNNNNNISKKYKPILFVMLKVFKYTFVL